MTTGQLIELINESLLYSLYDARKILSKHKIPQVAHELGADRHRWYEVATDVYKCEDGFVGITGVSCLYSENIMYMDCDTPCTAEEYEEVVEVTYKKK